MAHYESPSVSVTPCGTTGAGGDAECTVVWLQGEHDAATTKFLVATLHRAAELDGANVLVDLGAVTFMDASTIGAIVGARNRLARRARTLAIRAPSPAASRLLELCGLTDLVYATPATATHPTAAVALATWIDVPPSSGTRIAADAASTSVPQAAALSMMDNREP